MAATVLLTEATIPEGHLLETLVLIDSTPVEDQKVDKPGEKKGTVLLKAEFNVNPFKFTLGELFMPFHSNVHT